MAENKRRCKSCGEMIDSNAEYCLFCGAPQPINKNKESAVKRGSTKKVNVESNTQTQAKVVHAPQKIEKLPEVEKAVATEKKMRRQDDEIKNLKKEKEQLAYEALHDTALTGAANRTAYEQRLREIEDKDRCTVAIIDVNGLKKTNDKYGHQVGDDLIKLTATAIMNIFNGETSENVFRIGGDEFAIIIPVVSKEQIQVSVEELKETLNQATQEIVEKYELLPNYKISISFGIAYGNEADTLDDVIKLADERMYADKEEYKKATGQKDTKPRTGIVGYDANFDGYYDDIKAYEEDLEKKVTKEGIGKTLLLIVGIIIFAIIYEMLI